jgi:two-component system, NarL family, sensor histidine kinase BarA
MAPIAEGRTASLAAPRELLELVLARLHDGVLVADASGTRVYANEEAARLTGFASPDELLAAAPEEVLGRFDIRDRDGNPVPAGELPGRRALAGSAASEPLLVRFRQGSGPERVSEVRAVPVEDEHGATAYVISFFRDVTREVAAADETEALYRDAQRTTALLDALYRSAPVGLGFWDRDLRYVRVNEALAAINERPAGDHVGRTLREVVPQLADLLEPIARGVLETGVPAIGREMSGGTPQSPEAERHWRASYYPVLGPDGEAIGVGAVVEETTGRRRAEQRTELQHEVTRLLSTAETVDAAVECVLQAICGTLGWDVACYWPADPHAPQVTWARPGAGVEGFVALTERASLSPSMLPGRVMATGAPEWLESLDPERAFRAPIAEAEGLRSGVAFPVAIEGEVVGVVEAFTRFRLAVDADLLASLDALGGQLGQFLRRKRAEEERAQLLQRERMARADAEAAAATLRKLARVAEAALAHASLQDLLDALLQRIVEVLDADTAAILLLDDDGETLRVRAETGLTDELEHAVAVPLGMGLAGKVAVSRAPLLVPDLSQIELASPLLRERGINSLVAIPLVVEDRVIGVVHAGSEAYAQFVEEDARLLELIADRIALAINQAALYEAEREAQDRLSFLVEASASLASSLDVDRTLRRVAELAVPHFADWCIVDLVGADGSLERVTVAHVDPARADDLRSLVARHPSSFDDPRGVAAVIRSGEPTLQNDIGEELLRDAFADRPAYVDELLRLDLRATMIVPLVLRERTLGALTFVASGSRRRYTQADLAFAQELASRAAVAVDNARLYREAEGARDRLAFLAEASALLGSTLEVERTLEQLGTLVAGRIADWCSIHLLSESEPPRLVGMAGDVPAGAPEVDRAVARVVTRGEPDAADGLLVVPLKARGRTFGAMSLGTAGHAEADVEFALDLARRAAVAIDNAQLYGAAAERAQAARVLASVGDGVFLVDSLGYVRTWNRAAAIATGLPASDVVDRPAQEAIPGWSAIVGRVQVTSPGTTGPRAESLPLDLGLRELWISIHGVSVPDGIVYAFRDLTDERALEQMRTEFVSTVSHELRTPLAAIYGAAMTLRRSDVALDEDQRARLLDVVSGEADRLARTVNDILWASRLDTDTLSVTIQNCDPVALVHEVVKAQEAHLDGSHRLVVDAPDAVPLIAGDPDKIGRVLINLVDNGVKYSPDGGPVTVAVRPVGSHVRISVSDVGLGIPFGEQRRVFEKFYRLDPNMNRGVGGTGLGLYICRELVRRMDGRIWVESSGLGHGSTFNVELPAAAY